jgi:hypothetical protein
MGAAGAIVASTAIGMRSAKKAAKVQRSAASQAADAQLEMYRQMRSDLAPYRDVGASALERYSDIALKGNIEQFQQSPGYQFRLQEGIKALERGAAARGELLGGAQAKALTRFGQDYASNEYSNYLNQLGALASMGQSSATATGAGGLQSAAQRGGYLVGAGEAQASGIAARGRLLGQGVQSLIGNFSSPGGGSIGGYGGLGRLGGGMGFGT